MNNPLEENFAKDQISLNEFTDPFTGERTGKAKTNSHLEVAACNCDALVALFY